MYNLYSYQLQQFQIMIKLKSITNHYPYVYKYSLRYSLKTLQNNAKMRHH